MRRAVLLVLSAATAAVPGCDPASAPPPAGSGGAATGAVIPSSSAAALEKELREKGEIARSRPAGAPAVAAEDGALRQAVAARLAEDPDIPGFLIEVEAARGQVTLTGRVGSYLQLEKAIDAVLALPGVVGVRARLHVEPDDGSGAVKGEAETR